MGSLHEAFLNLGTIFYFFVLLLLLDVKVSNGNGRNSSPGWNVSMGS